MRDVKKNHGNENKQRTKKISEEGNEVHVVIEDNSPQRRLSLEKIINLFANIKYDGNGNDQCQGEEKRPQKFLNNI
jgi:hypothetical protein